MSQHTRKDLKKSNPEDYFKSISTQEADVSIHISEGDEKWMLIQMGRVPFSCAYLSDEQALALQQAIAEFLATKNKVQEEPATMPYPREQYVKNAKATYENDELEIDEDAELSRVDVGDSGCWVSSWVWVPDSDMQIDYPSPDRQKIIDELVADHIDNFDIRGYLKTVEPELRDQLARLSDTELKQRHEEIFGE